MRKIYLFFLIFEPIEPAIRTKRISVIFHEIVNCDNRHIFYWGWLMEILPWKAQSAT